eukprot:6195796-Pleurochrysis_carterae.AAC.5
MERAVGRATCPRSVRCAVRVLLQQSCGQHDACRLPLPPTFPDVLFHLPAVPIVYLHPAQLHQRYVNHIHC